jgi:serine/threonine-protein kinase HipA
MKKAKVFMYNKFAGVLTENEEGYHFQYDENYLHLKNSESISLTLPIRSEAYTSSILFPFFDGLIPEGWLLDITLDNWKLNIRDRMSILMVACRDCIGAVSVEAEESE